MQGDCGLEGGDTRRALHTQTNAAVITVEVRRGNPVPPTFPLGLVAG